MGRGQYNEQNNLYFFQNENFCFLLLLYLLFFVSSVNEVRINGKTFSDAEVTPHILYVALFFIIFLASFLVCLMFGVDNKNAIMGTLSCLDNVGPAVGSLGTFGNYGMEPVMAKVMYTIDMFMGRVEIYPVLAVASFIFTRRKR